MFWEKISGFKSRLAHQLRETSNQLRLLVFLLFSMGFAIFVVCNSIRLSAFSYWNIANLDANLATKLDTKLATKLDTDLSALVKKRSEGGD